MVLFHLWHLVSQHGCLSESLRLTRPFSYPMTSAQLLLFHSVVEEIGKYSCQKSNSHSAFYISLLLSFFYRKMTFFRLFVYYSNLLCYKLYFCQSLVYSLKPLDPLPNHILDNLLVCSHIDCLINEEPIQLFSCPV